MKKFKMLMMFVLPLVVVIVGIAVVTGFLSAVNQTVSMDNSFRYEKHIGSGTEEDPYLIYDIGNASPKLVSGKMEYAESGSFNFYAGNNKDNKNYFEAENNLNTNGKYSYFKQVEDLEMKSGQTLLSTMLLGYYDGAGKIFKTNQTVFTNVGNGVSNNSAYIKNLQVQTIGKIEANASVALKLFGSLENIVFNGSIVSKTGESISFDGGYKPVAGGLVQSAYAGAKIRKCRNIGSVESDGVAGGLIGIVNSSSSSEAVLIQECFNKGTVYSKEQSTKGYVGGIIGGMFSNVNIYTSYNLGFLSSLSTNSVGGLVGLNKDRSLNLNQAYSVVAGTGNSAFIASGNVNANSSIGIVCDNGGSAISDSGSTVSDINIIQNKENYQGWFNEDSSLWVMAFDAANIGSMQEQKIVNLYSPHLAYEVENISGNFNLNYDNGEATSGTTPETRSYSKLNSIIQIQDNLGGLTKIGYTFKGWSTIKDASSPLFALDLDGAMPSLEGVYSLQDEVSLYPVWELKTSYAYINPNFGTWNNSKLNDFKEAGFEYNASTGYLKIAINAKKSEIQLPTGEDISREGFEFRGFKVVSDCENVYPSTVFNGAVLSFIPEGTCGNDITLEAVWEGNENIEYYVIYELANKTNGFSTATQKYIFKKIGKAGTELSLENNFFQNLGYSNEVSEVRIYESGKTYDEMEVLTDVSSVMANIEKHFNRYELNVQNTNNTGSIIDGDGNTVASVRYLRNTYKVTLLSGDNISTVKLEQNKDGVLNEGLTATKIDVNKIEWSAIYGVPIVISAVEKSGYLAVWYKVLENGAREKFSGLNAVDLVAEEDITLEAVGVGGYTLEIYANNAFATLNNADGKYDNFIASLNAQIQGNYYYDDYNKVLVIKNQKMGEDVILPLLERINENISYELFKVLKDNDGEIISLQDLLGFSLDKNAIAPDSNITTSFNSNMAEVVDGVIKLYAVWTKFEANLKITYYEQGEPASENDIVLTNPSKTFSAVRPSIVSTIAGVDGDANNILISRPGFKFLGFMVAGENSFGGVIVGDYISIDKIMTAELFQDVEIVAKWEQLFVTFTVNVYREKIDGSYELKSSETISNYKTGDSYSLNDFKNLENAGFKFTLIQDSLENDLTEYENVALPAGNYSINVYYNRIVVYLTFEKGEGIDDIYITDGVNKLVIGDMDSEASFKNLGFIEANGSIYSFKFGSEITIQAKEMEGFSFDSFQKKDISEEYVIIGYNPSMRITLDEQNNVIKAVAQENYKIRLNLGDVITADMVNVITNANIEVIDGEYYLKNKFSNKTSYDANTFLKFALYELKAEYDNCQTQNGWSDGINNIITWDIAGNLVINTDFALTPNAENIADIYAVWTTNTYMLSVNYDSDVMENIIEREIPVPSKFEDLQVNLEPTKTGYNLDYFTMQIDKTNSGVFVDVENAGSTKLTKEFLDTYTITRSVRLQAYWTTTNTKTEYKIVTELVTDNGASVTEYYVQALNPAVIDTSGAVKSLEGETNSVIELRTIVNDLEDAKQIISKNYDIKYFYKDSANADWEEIVKDFNFSVKADGSSFAKIQYVKKQVGITVKGDGNVEVSLDGVNYYPSHTQNFEIDKTVKIYLKFNNGYQFDYASENVTDRDGYYEYIALNDIEISFFAKAISYNINIDKESLKDTYLGSVETTDTLIFGRILQDSNTVEFKYENGIASYSCISSFNLPVLSKKGYVFKGYRIAYQTGAVYSIYEGGKIVVNNDDVIDNIAYGSYADITLYAEFEAIGFNITFDANKLPNMADSNVTIPAGVVAVVYGQEVDLGIAETDNVAYGFKGWATHKEEGVGVNLVSDANGKSVWNFIPEDFETYTKILDNNYNVTVYAFWSEFKKEIRIGGDSNRIETLEVTTVESAGGANAKVLKTNNGYSIYLNDNYVVKLKVETTNGYDVYENGSDSWKAGENTTYTFNKYSFVAQAEDETYSAKEFELNLQTEGYKVSSTGNVANILFVAKSNTYILTYDFNYDGSITTVVNAENAKTEVVYQTNVYTTSPSSLERLLTPTELIELGLVTISNENGTTNGLPNGYKFGGWYKDSACTLGNELMYMDRAGNWISNAYKIPNNGVVFAKWVPVEYNINLVRNYDENDEKVLAQVNQKFGEELGNWFVNYPKSDDIKAGYKFKAWAFTKTGVDGEGNSTILENVAWNKYGEEEWNLYAIWEAKQFYLTPDTNKNNLSLQSKLIVTDYDYDNIYIEVGTIENYLDAKILVEFDKPYEVNKVNGSVPTRLGYKFLGWYALTGTEWYQITNEEGNSVNSVWNINSDDEEILICTLWTPDVVNVTINVYEADVDGNYLEEEKQTFNKEYLADTYVAETNGVVTDIKNFVVALKDSSDIDNKEVKFYHNSNELIDTKSWIAYADGGLVVNIKYARKTLQINLGKDDAKADKIELLSLIEDENEITGDSISKYIVYGKTITINAVLYKGVEWQGWYNGNVQYSNIKEYSFEVTEELNLVAMAKYIEYEIIYNNVEEVVNAQFKDVYTKIDAFELPNLTDKRKGYAFVGYLLDVCEDSECNHSICGKYYNVNYGADGKITANLIKDNIETLVELNVSYGVFDSSELLDRKLIKNVNAGSMGTLVLKAVWEGNEGTKFNVQLREQNLAGNFNSEEKTFYTKSGTEINGVDKTQSFYIAFDGANYTGEKVNIYDFAGVDEECFDRWYISDVDCQTEEDILNNKLDTISVSGDGSTIIYLYKLRKIINLKLDATVSAEETFKSISISSSDSKIILTLISGDVVEINANETHTLEYTNLTEILNLQVLYGGTIEIKVMDISNAFKLKVYASDVEIVDSGDNKYVVSNIINTMTIVIGTEEFSYKAKLNINDASWNNGSTFIAEESISINDKEYMVSADQNGYNKYVEIDIKSTTITNLPVFTRVGYTFLGWSLEESSTGTISNSKTNSNGYYTGIAGIGNYENEVVLVLKANWEADDVNISYVITEGASTDLTYKFDADAYVLPEDISADDHNAYINSGKRFLGWFIFNKSTYLNSVGLNPNVDWVKLEDCTDLTDAEKEELANGYAFGIKNYDNNGKIFNVMFNNAISNYPYTTANSPLSSIEEYLVASNYCQQYLNNVDDFQTNITLYAWYITDCYQITFDLNLDETLADVDETVRNYFASAGELTINWFRGTDYANSQKTPIVEILESWGNIKGYSIYKNKTEATEFVEGENYFSLSEGGNFLVGDVASKIPDSENGKILYAIWERNNITVSYSLGFDDETLNFSQSEPAPFKASFVNNGVDYSDLSGLTTGQTINGLDAANTSYFEFKGWKITFEGNFKGLNFDNEYFYLQSDLDKEILLADINNIKNKYATFNGVNLTAVWEQKVVIIDIHSNYASDYVDADGNKVKEEINRIVASLNDTVNLKGSSNVGPSGYDVGVSGDKDSCVPDYAYYAENDSESNPVKPAYSVLASDLVKKYSSKNINLYIVWLGTIDKPFEIETIADFNFLAGGKAKGMNLPAGDSGNQGISKFANFMKCEDYFGANSSNTPAIYVKQVQKLIEDENNIMVRPYLYKVYYSIELDLNGNYEGINVSKIDGSLSMFRGIAASFIGRDSNVPLNISINNAQGSIFADNIKYSSIKKVNTYGSITSAIIAGENTGGTKKSNSEASADIARVKGMSAIAISASVVVFDNINNYADIIANEASKVSAGLIGVGRFISIKNAVNYGSIKCSEGVFSAGGIVGSIEGQLNVDIYAQLDKELPNLKNGYRSSNSDNSIGFVIQGPSDNTSTFIPYNYPSLYNVKNYGNISGNIVIAGGIAGMLKASMDSCSNYGAINVKADKVLDVDVMRGGTQESSLPADQNTEESSSAIELSTTVVGGLAGLQMLNMKLYYNETEESSLNNSMPVAGKVVALNAGEFDFTQSTNLYNSADITIEGKKLPKDWLNNNALDDLTALLPNAVFTGGIYGLVMNFSLTSKSSIKLETLTLKNVINTGSIIDNTYSIDETNVSLLGGITGYVGLPNAFFETIIDRRVGGEISLNNCIELSISDSYTTGVIKGETNKDGMSYAGGFIGYALGQTINISSSYSMSALEGKFNSGIGALNGTIINETTFTNNYFVNYNYSSKSQSSYKANCLNDSNLGTAKTLSQMQALSTYEGFEWKDINDANSWFRANSSSLIYAPMKVQGIERLVRLPRLSMEELTKGEYKVYYDSNSVRKFATEAELINVSGSNGSYALIGSSILSYNNKLGRIEDINTYSDASTFTIADGSAYRVTNYSGAQNGEVAYKWFFRKYYSFVGFALDPNAKEEDVMSGEISNLYFSGDLVFYAIWKPIEFNITYDNLKGALNGENPVSYNIESEFTFKPLSGVAGYKFNSWYNNPDLDESHKQAKIEYGTTLDKTFYAGWDRLPYTLTVDVDGTISNYTYYIDDISAVNLNTIKSDIEANNSDKTFGHFKVVSMGSNPEESAEELLKILSNGNKIEEEDKIETIDLGSYGNIEIAVVWKGSEEDAYEIDSIETFNNYVDQGLFGKGYFFKLVADLEVTNTNKLKATSLKGIFDGGYTDEEGNNKNHSIKILNSTPLFVSVDGTIKNLDYYAEDFEYNASGISGVLAGSYQGVLENVKAYGTVTATLSSGNSSIGLIERANTGALAINLCENHINYNINVSNSAYYQAGGFVGETNQNIKITNSLNTGNINIEAQGYIYVGGFIGIGRSEMVEITGSLNKGQVKATVPSGTIVAGGGLVGLAHRSTILYSYNIGNITVSSPTTTGINVGGLISGFQSSYVVINYSYNLGLINPLTEYGGLIGKIYNGTAGQEGAVVNETLSDYGQIKYSYYLAETEAVSSNSYGLPKTIASLTNKDNYPEEWYIRKLGTKRDDNSAWYWQWIDNGQMIINGSIERYSLPRLWWEDLTEIETVLITFQNDKTNPTDSYTQEVAKGLDAILKPIQFSKDRFLYWVDDADNKYYDQSNVKFDADKTLYAFYTDQDGSEGYPYLISNAEDFNKYASNGAFENPELYFRQVADFSTDALNQASLMAHYDGNNHTITFTAKTTQPLFINVGSESNSATLTNLTVVVSNSTTAIIAESLYGSINRVITKGTINATLSVGGLVTSAYGGSQIIQCANFATINASGVPNVGGIVASVESTNDKNVVTITECVNYGTITNVKTTSGSTSAGYSGGIVGKISSKTNITRCYNVGNITGGTTAGIIGLVTEYINGDINVSDTYNVCSSVGKGILGADQRTNYSLVFTNVYSRSDGDEGVIDAGYTGMGVNSVTYNKLRRQATYANWTFGINGTDTTGWVFINAKVPFSNGEKIVRLPRLAWENLTEEELQNYELTLAYASTDKGAVTENGGTLSASTYEIDPNGTEVTISATVNEGYSFAGWYINENGSFKLVSEDASFTVTLDEDTKYYALYKIRVYITNHNSSDSSIDGDTIEIYVLYGQKASITFDLEDGIMVGGIYSSKSTISDSLLLVAGSDLETVGTNQVRWITDEVYAPFNAYVLLQKVLYRITFNSMNADVQGTEYVDVSIRDALTNIEVPSKTDKAFMGYYTETDGNGTQYFDYSGSPVLGNLQSKGDITLYAYWKDIIKVNVYVDGVHKAEVDYITGALENLVSGYAPSPYSTGWFFNEELTRVVSSDYLNTDITAGKDISLYCRTASITGLTFTLSSDSNSYLVAGESETSPSGAVVLPNRYNGKPVTGFVTGTSSSPTFKKNTNITSVVLSNNISSIANYTFKNCTNLTHITIPNCVKSIGSIVFEHCDSLTSVEIPDSVTSVGNGMFRYCGNLTNVIIGNGVKEIRNATFFYCSSLKNINIPDSVTSIGSYAFDSCTSLTSIKIPRYVNSIVANVFDDCIALSSIIVDSGNTTYDSRNNCNAIIETATNTLIQGCQSTIIPNTVLKIDNYAFYKVGNLASITMPSSVVSIGQSAFNGCSGLTSVILSNNLTSIEASAFNNCTGLTKIFMPKSVTTISASSSSNAIFYGCSSNLVIYCEASSKPDGWDIYWNYRTDSAIHTTYWGKTYEDCYPVEYSVSVGKYSLSPNTGCSYSVSPSTILSTGTEVTYKAIVSDGYRFMGWYDSISGGELVSNNETYVTTLYRPTTYYAYWQLAQDINIVVDSRTTQVPYYTGNTIANTVKSYEPTYFTGWFLDSGLTQIATTSFLQETSFEGSLLTLYCKTASIAGLVFTLTDDGNSYLVAGESETSPSGNIVIPNKYNGKPVIGFASGGQTNPVFKKNANITSVTLPSSITSVGNYAFYACKAITNINIPNSVLTIGYSSFGYCNALVEIVLPNTVTSIDAMAFSDCGALEKVVLPTGIKAIERYTFWTCSSLKSITIPDTVETIGMSAFNKCFKLTSIRIPKNVKSIGTGAFKGCGNVTSIVVDSSNTVYDSRNNCNAIIETATNTLIQGCNYTTIPNTVTSIGDGSFVNMKKMTSITIPNSVVTIGSSVFTYCSGLTSIILSTNLTSIGAGAFVYCTGLTKIFIPKSVTTITAESSNTYPFRECNSTLIIYCEASSKPSGFGTYWNYYDDSHALTTYWNQSIADVLYPYLTFTLNSDNNSYSVGAKNTSISGEIVIPESYNGLPVTAIADDGFNGCSSITNIVIPESVTSIGISSFYDCSGITNLVIPSSVVTIGEKAFQKCTGLESIQVSGNNTKFSSPNNCNAIIVTSTKKLIYGCKNTVIPTNILTIGDHAFFNVGFSTITIPSSVTNIGEGAFYGSTLTNIVIPNSVKIIGESAFSNCASLASVTLGTRLTTLGVQAFGRCTALTSIIIPSNVRTIGTGCFMRCSNLASVTIESGVTTIGGQAFHTCIALSKIFIPLSVTSITAANANASVFSNCSTLEIYCEASSKPSGWGTYWNYYNTSTACTTYWGQTRESMDSPLRFILNSDGASYSVKAGSTSIAGAVTIPSTYNGKPVTAIADSGFNNCSSITSIEIPNSITTIEGFAFNRCTGLTGIEIPESVTSIKSYAFQSCSGLTSITIPSGVTTITLSVFDGCTGLTNIYIPDGVTSIVDLAFSGCTSLTKLFIPKSVTSITGSNYTSSPFFDCSSTMEIYCEVSSKPSGWATYWNYYDSGKILTTYWGQTRDSMDSPFVFTLNSNGTTYNVKAKSTSISGAVTIPSTYNGKSVTAIAESGFSKCSNITSITIPSSITSIGDSAFVDCTGLTSLTIPSSAKTWGDFAFERCSNLSSINIPSGVTRLGYGVFLGCKKLTSITIPNSVTMIDDSAFQACSGLTSVTFGTGIKTIGLQAFAYCTGLTERLVLPENMNTLSDGAFEGCTGLTRAFIPQSTTTIEGLPFRACSSRLVLGTDVPYQTGGGSVPSGWNEMWCYIDSSTKLGVAYGASR